MGGGYFVHVGFFPGLFGVGLEAPVQQHTRHGVQSDSVSKAARRIDPPKNDPTTNKTQSTTENT